MNIHRSTPITIARYGRSRNKTQDFEELSSIRSAEPSQSFSPNLGSPSPPETPNLSHCVSCIGKYLLLEPLEGDHVFRAVHLHSGEELVCKVTSPALLLRFVFCLKIKLKKKNHPGSFARGRDGAGGLKALKSRSERFLGSLCVASLNRFICVSVHVRLVAKFSDRFRQWGGLQAGAFWASLSLG